MAAHLNRSDIHGFRTMEDLDMVNVLEEAKARWLRPNEIHAILCNYYHFKVQVKPLNLPTSGTLVLFDRKKLRNFRKDGHSWKKKKDGKTVKEAHEHLKVGNEERIHVYYAHGEDNPTFVRRCYWLLDKSLEHIVLVHYRETKELQGSPATSGFSNSSSAFSDPSASWITSEESDSVVDLACQSSQQTNSDPKETVMIKDQELRLHELNTLEWDELLVPDDSNTPTTHHGEGYTVGPAYLFEVNGYRTDTDTVSAYRTPTGSYLENHSRQSSRSGVGGQIVLTSQQKSSSAATAIADDSLEYLIKDGVQNQGSFGRWMNLSIGESPSSLDNTAHQSLISTNNQHTVPPTADQHHHSSPGQIFYITDISPSWASSTEETKALVVGQFHSEQSNLATSNILCVCGDVCIPAQLVHSGVYRVVISPQTPGYVNFFLSFDGHKPISQVLALEFRAPQMNSSLIYSEDDLSWETFQAQMRLARLLFSTSRRTSILSNKFSQDNLDEAKKFTRKIPNIEDSWAFLTKSVKASEISFNKAKSCLFELSLQNRLYEWLLEIIVEGCNISERDEEGQGVIHLCAILGYEWAVYPFSWSGLSLDYRDNSGWTALHWAAFYGREDMVAKLLSAGAKANLVTDPTSDNPGGFTPADLASKNGHEGLSAYLAEKALVQHFEAMTLAGNVSGSLQPGEPDSVNTGTFSEEQLYLKDTLAAYRNAADAAARIQAAFREHSLKVQTLAVESSNPELDARSIVAAMKIQHAFRNYETRKQLAAVARIQYRFRTWKMRRDFLNVRRQAVRIQAVFRGFQVRRHYRKIVWSVGVVEKAVLRWRLKRKGFRGLKVNPPPEVKDQQQENDTEEDFFRASRKQAEERVERSVVRVQAMFRSKKAQEEYRRMKFAYSNATLEYEELQNPDGMREG